MKNSPKRLLLVKIIVWLWLPILLRTELLNGKREEYVGARSVTHEGDAEGVDSEYVFPRFQYMFCLRLVCWSTGKSLSPFFNHLKAKWKYFFLISQNKLVTTIKVGCDWFLLWDWNIRQRRCLILNLLFFFDKCSPISETALINVNYI
jgi:hypothetical protein